MKTSNENTKNIYFEKLFPYVKDDPHDGDHQQRARGDHRLSAATFYNRVRSPSPSALTAWMGREKAQALEIFYSIQVIEHIM